jgi:hypothetical protein
MSLPDQLNGKHGALSESDFYLQKWNGHVSELF